MSSDPILKLNALQVYNWGYAPFLEPLPIGDLTLLYGANGSGKTTYLTALGLLLGVRSLPRGESFDRYIRYGEEWAFLRAIVDNHPDEKGTRPFSHIIPNAEDCDQCTLACMIVYQSGSWQRQYFIVPGADFMPEPKVKTDHPHYRFKLKTYQQALEAVGVRQALLKLLELGVLGIRDMREPKALFDFFVKLVGSEEIRENYNQARRNWREARDRTDRLQDRYEIQKKDLSEIETQIKIQRQRREITARLSQNQALVDHAKLRDMRDDYDNRYTEQQLLFRQKQDTEWELTEIVARREGLEAEQTAFDEQYNEWKSQRDQTEVEFNQLDKKHGILAHEVTQLRTYVEALRAIPEADLQQIQEDYDTTQDQATAQRDICYRLKSERDNLQAEREELLGGQTPLPRYVSDFLKALQAEKIPYLLLADTVNTTDSKWLRAVEGALGGERFTVIIKSDQHQLAAKRIAQKMRYRHWISPPQANHTGKQAANSLLDVVEVAEPDAYGWVAERLSRIQRVETVEEGHRISQQNGNIAITPEAYLQQKRGGRSVWVKDLVCGANAREQRLQEVETQLADLTNTLEAEEQTLAELNERLTSLRHQIEAAQRRAELPTKEHELAEKQQEMDTLQSKRDTLEANYQKLKDKEDAQNKRRTELALQHHRIESKEERIKNHIEKLSDQAHALGVSVLRDQITELEVTLSPLSLELEERLKDSGMSATDYQRQIESDETKLKQLPELEHEVNEDLYRQQVSDLEQLSNQLDDMRSRARDARELFERATQDYSHHIDQIFSQGMNREFRQLCRAVDAQSDVTVLKSAGDLDNWSLDIRIGFDGKNKQPLSSAPLSRGQEVLTGLYLVLAALRAVKATPILILDELMSLLDERNAPRVLAGLRDAHVQCFVATPQSRPGADEFSDVMWGFFKRAETEDYAPPVAVMAHRHE